ncbi:hypothetical protein O7602_16515 [Micromonospora sp. WMMD1128]|uniref:hypothetical protein n=1 Tax=unclassified Micromonospora TaxID=2617518 RepID=UPI00248AF05E|nr:MULTISPECIES: hypothetical protein [unclassified Micromonospora]WBB71365.1 hypothetical protein O7602_16515 [Micromonospora sp. WMMD1128]WFE35166.1 hypothetical protein O7613_07255 [Micromonospora sp. WMMD975]
MGRRRPGRALRGAAVTGRFAWGALLLLAPGTLLRPVGPATTAATTTLRVLGARHLAQTAVVLRWPAPGVLAAGAAVDGVHALTALALAAVDRRQRHAALADAAVAAAWAALGATVVREEKP